MCISIMQFSTSPESQKKLEGSNITDPTSQDSKAERLAYLNEKFEKPEPVYNEKLSKNFPGSTIVKKIDGTYFAVRKNADGWEGSEFKLMNDGSVGAVYQARNIPPDIIKTVETQISLTIPVLNRDLIKIGTASPEERSEFVNSLKNLPPGTHVDLYHGLNGGSDGALKVLDSDSRGIKQISGPCLAAYPVGQFWKPGDAGFKYSVPKDDIEFPGENKPSAKFRMENDGIVYMINGLTELPIDEYEGVVMRTDRKVDILEEKVEDGVWRDIVVGEKTVPLTAEERKISADIQKKLQDLSSIRKNRGTSDQ